MMGMKNLARLATLAVYTLFPFISVAQTTVVGGVNSEGGWFFGIGSGWGNIAIGCNYNTICQVASQFLYIINYVLVPLLFAVAFIAFLYGVVRAYIFSHGDPEKIKEGHQLILWGIIGFVVMISLWGIVNVVANTFGLAGYSAPPLPTSF